MSMNNSAESAAKSAAASATTAAGSAEYAVEVLADTRAARDAATAIVIADADTAMATAINTPGSQAGTALSASTAATVDTVLNDPAGPLPPAVTTEVAAIRDAASGVAPLDASRKLPEANVPDRLATSNLVTSGEVATAPQRHGAKGDGITNDTTALQAWLTAGGGYLPPGTYGITATLTIPAGVDIDAHPLAVIKALSSIAGPMLDTPAGTTLRNRAVRNLTLDCNGFAQTGFYPRRFGNYQITDLKVLNPTVCGVMVGDPASGSVSYGAAIHNLLVDRTFGAAAPAGSTGVWVRNATDGVLHAPNGPIGVETGVKVEAACAGWKFLTVHPWGYAAGPPATCFDDAADGNVYIACDADTPTSIGYRIRGYRTRLVGCRAYNNGNYGTDNVATGIYFDKGDPLAVLTGVEIAGASGTRRFAKDLDGAAGFEIGLTIDGLDVQNAVTTALTTRKFKQRWRQLLTDGSAATWRNVANTIYVAISTTAGSERLELLNGANLRGYSDNYTTRTFTLGNNGIGLPKFTTAARPTAATAGAGFVIYDTTISKPVCSDGTAWRDFAGTVV